MKDQPPLPVQEIIDKFASHEEEFRQERNNFTYTQDYLLQEFDDDTDQPSGEYRFVSDIAVTPDGKRFEKITYAPEPTLKEIRVTQEDLDDLIELGPFSLGTSDLAKYNLTYVGQQKVDAINAYVFDVAPKTIEKNHRYFQGRIWVDDHDFAIVKADGKAVPDIRKGGEVNAFPRFQTYRQNIEGHYWFPTYTHADDTLHLTNGSVRVRVTVKYTEYKRFRVTARLVGPSEAPDAPSKNP